MCHFRQLDQSLLVPKRVTLPVISLLVIPRCVTDKEFLMTAANKRWFCFCMPSVSESVQQ